VMLQLYHLAFLPAVCKIQFSLYYAYTLFQVPRSMWLLTIHRLSHRSSLLLLVALSGIICMQQTMFPMLKTCKSTVSGAFLTCTNFTTGFTLPEFSLIVVSARANQYSTKAPSSLQSLILNSRCSCHGTRPFRAL